MLATTTLAELVPPGRVGDLLVEVPARGTGRPAAIIVDVQLEIDPLKALSWPLQWAAVHAGPKFRGGQVLLVVIAIDRATEDWAREVLGAWLPRDAGVVIGPSNMPRITSVRAARRDPGIAILSALMHAGRDDVELVPALLEAMSRMPPERGMLFDDLTRSRSSQQALELREELMQKGEYVWQSDFAIRHRAEGRAEGLARGHAKGLAKGLAQGHRAVLLDVIRTRKLRLTAAQRATIAACKDLEQLREWSCRAVTARTPAAIFASGADDQDAGASRRRHARAPSRTSRRETARRSSRRRAKPARRQR